MITVDVPGSPRLEIRDVVCDFNGTLAFDGALIDGVRERLAALAAVATLHVVTADTFGMARTALAGVDMKLTVLPAGDHAEAKAAYVECIGAAHTAAVGNGRNDRAMLAAAALSIAVIGPEGAAAEALAAAQIAAPDIRAALDLLLRPKRLIATLRR